MKEIKYLSSHILSSEIKDELRSYFENNLVDDSIFWPVFLECLDMLGGKYNPEKITVLEVRNKVTDLPEGFERLILALGCVSGTVTLEDQRRVSTEEVSVEELDLCQSSCDVCTDDCGNMYRIVQKNHRVTVNWDTFNVLHLGTTSKDLCINDCLNFKSTSLEQIELKNSKIITNFDSGYIYLEYESTLENGDEILYPKHERINKWIKAKLREAVFQYLYFNGIGDNLTRYREAQRVAYIAEEQAKSVFKASGVSSFYNLANILTRRYNRLARSIWNERSYSGHYGI